MSYSSRSNTRRRKQTRYASIFVDYNSLIDILHRSLPSDEIPDDYILPILTQLRTVLQRKHRLQTTTFRAYGDFSAPEFDDASVLHALYASGAEPRFVSSATPQDPSMRLCIDVMETLFTQPDVYSIVLVSGDQAFLPLIRQIRERGRQAVLATLAAPDVPEEVLWTDDAVSLDLVNLLDEPLRRHLYTSPTRRSRSNRPTSFTRIEDPTTLTTLEIIEEHFGHYDEIYLTPLLRKLSDVFDDPAYDPKSVIGVLEDANAVRLEKRHGTPYDYTVLILESNHPDVALIQERVYSERQYEHGVSATDDDYSETDGYSDASYDEDYPEEDDYDAAEDTYVDEFDEEEPDSGASPYASNGEDVESYTLDTASDAPGTAEESDAPDDERV